MKKIIAMLLVVVMVLSMAACANNDQGETTANNTPETTVAGVKYEDGVAYTYNTYASALATNWNPHTWEMDSDSTVMGYIEAPLATMSILDSENGVYQWVYVAAESVTDVTAANQGDLTKYNVTLPEGQTPETTEKGFVFEIKLNPDMKWQNGEAINADTYIYSMKALLDPAMRNYRANLYYAGESAVAGGNTYYNSGAPIYTPMVPAYEDTPDYSFDLAAAIADGTAYIALDSYETTLMGSSYSFKWMASNGYAEAALVEALSKDANPYGYTKVTAENFETVKSLIAQVMAAFGYDLSTMPEEEVNGIYMEGLFYGSGEKSPVADYDSTVGCYKVDEYTIRYVTQSQIDINYFLTSCTSNWIVYEDLYEAGKDTTGALVTTDYGTSPEKTMAYGPYMLESMQDAKQMVFVKNPEYYLYTESEDGRLVAVTDYLVDGENVTAYETDKIVINVMNDEAAKQAFMKGELNDWNPPADEVATYAASTQMYKVDETFTMSFFFNSNLEKLQEMDNSKGNTNSVVLSNYNFRKAFSLAIDRTDWVNTTPGFKPAYYLMNSLYHYDVYNDPTSSYRNADAAMQAICDLYGVKYGEGTPYATLRDAYLSINGYNLTEAKNLMATACDELVAAGLYTEGEPIHIRIGWSAGAIDSAGQNMVAKIQQYLNAAVEGSGFGAITLEPIDNISNRYNDVANGEYAFGYGAWGGAAFYPFRNMQVYCDPSQYSIHEAGCWDPSVETLTLTINGEEVTQTWQWWSQCLVGSGAYANESNEFKLEVTAAMEREYLNKYYRIPLAVSCVASLLSYQVSYYTEDYNIMYGFGGLELMTYNYTDAEWADYVASQGGTLSYE